MEDCSDRSEGEAEFLPPAPPRTEEDQELVDLECGEGGGDGLVECRPLERSTLVFFRENYVASSVTKPCDLSQFVQN